MFKNKIIRKCTSVVKVHTMSSLVTRTITPNKICILKLNDPSKLNAMSYELGLEFKNQVAEIQEEVISQNVKGLILTGNGKAFSAGGDLDWLRERGTASPFRNQMTMMEYYNLFLGIKDIYVPTVAAINGAAVGAGLAVACICDMRIVKSNAMLGFPFGKLGIHPGMASTLSLEKLIGHQQAAHLLLTGNMINGDQAEKIGLVLESIEIDDNDKESTVILDRAIELINSCIKNSPEALQATVTTLRRRKLQGLEEALEREAFNQAINYTTENFKLGVEGVATKTTPEFQKW